MNIVDLLLKVDANEVKMPEGEHTMLCRKMHQEFTFPIKAIDPQIMCEIQERAIDLTKGEVNKIDTFKLKAHTIIEGCNTFKNKDLMKHFGAPTPIELVKKLLLNGEMDALNNAISELNGVVGIKEEEETTEEIKN